MRLLVLGGTRFLSRAVATQAVDRGWDVTCACRGDVGAAAGRRHPPAVGPRRSTRRPALVEGSWDAVVDVSRLPSHVRRAVAAVPDAHWVFVSTINVYADNGSPAMEPLRRADHRRRGPRRGPRGLRPDEGRVRADRDRRRRVLDARAARPHRRPGRRVRPLLLLARPAGPGRRGAGARVTRRRGPGHRRTRPGGVDPRRLRGPDDRGLRRRRRRRCRWPRLLDEVAAGVGAEPSFTWVDSDFLEPSRTWSPGPARARSRCGCRGRSTTG